MAKEQRTSHDNSDLPHKNTAFRPRVSLLKKDKTPAKTAGASCFLS